MEFFLIKDNIADVESDSVVFFCYEGQRLPAAARKIDSKLGGFLSDKVKSSDFKGAFGKTVVVDTPGDFNTKTVVLLGLGKKKISGHLRLFAPQILRLQEPVSIPAPSPLIFPTWIGSFLRFFLRAWLAAPMNTGSLNLQEEGRTG